jgi:hypothetical protein
VPGNEVLRKIFEHNDCEVSGSLGYSVSGIYSSLQVTWHCQGYESEVMMDWTCSLQAM